MFPFLAVSHASAANYSTLFLTKRALQFHFQVISKSKEEQFRQTVKTLSLSAQQCSTKLINKMIDKNGMLW